MCISISILWVLTIGFITPEGLKPHLQNWEGVTGRQGAGFTAGLHDNKCTDVLNVASCQFNGSVGNIDLSTDRKRPWEMILSITCWEMDTVTHFTCIKAWHTQKHFPPPHTLFLTYCIIFQELLWRCVCVFVFHAAVTGFPLYPLLWSPLGMSDRPSSSCFFYLPCLRQLWITILHRAAISQWK